MTRSTIVVPIYRIAQPSRAEAERIWELDYDNAGPPLTKYWPIILSDKMYVLDGMHRLASALGEGRETILAVIATPEEKRDFIGTEDEEANQEWIDRVLERAEARAEHPGELP